MTHARDIEAPGGHRTGDAARPTLFDRMRDVVPRLVASPRFRSLIAGIPLIRGVARHQTQALFDLCAGFVYSQILFAFVETGALEKLAEGPLSPEDLAGKTGLTADSAERLLRAAAALDLAAPRSRGRFGLGIRGAALVDNPGVIAMIKHHGDLYKDLSDPVSLLHGTAGRPRIAQYWSYLADDRAESLSEEAAAEYSGLMALSQTMIAELVTDSFPFQNYERILDVGGGTGVFLQHVAAKTPVSALTLFDLPPVASVANRRLERIGLGHRIRTIGGDFATDRLPDGQDLVTLVRVVYDHNDATVLSLLKACRTALRDGGALLIAEPLSGEGPGARVADAYFGFYLLAMGSGRTRSPAQHTALLNAAGFAKVSTVTTSVPNLVRLILARV